jgi:hypothetical protein
MNATQVGWHLAVSKADGRGLYGPGGALTLALTDLPVGFNAFSKRIKRRSFAPLERLKIVPTDPLGHPLWCLRESLFLLEVALHIQKYYLV